MIRARSIETESLRDGSPGGQGDGGAQGAGDLVGSLNVSMASLVFWTEVELSATIVSRLSSCLSDGIVEAIDERDEAREMEL